MSAARLLIYPEGAGRFRYACADPRLSMIHTASGDLVVLRMIATGVVEYR